MSTDANPRAEVTLREITRETLGSFLKLSVAEHQRDFVADNAKSIAQAHFSEYAWFRGIYAGDEAVGFVMLYDDERKPEYFLWRFMIDAKQQGKGYGRSAIQALIEHVRTRPGATELGTSVVPAKAAPNPSMRSSASPPRVK